MNADPDARLLERLERRITARVADGVDVINMPAVRGGRRLAEWRRRQQDIVMGGSDATRLCPSFDIIHFDVEHRALNAVHTIIVAGDNVVIFGFLTPVAK